MEIQRYAIIVAGGSGTRMGARMPKQFLDLCGKPVLRHTVEKFQQLPYPVEMIIVLPREWKKWWKTYCEENDFLPRYIMPDGGFTRFHSVQNALKYVPDGALVAVHDGVRPLVTPEFLERMYDAALEHGAAIPVIKPVETVREMEGEGSYVIDRENVRLVQTPQTFRSEILREAYRAPYQTSFTDDASVVESAGYKVALCEGIRYNVKITTPEDLELARLLI